MRADAGHERGPSVSRRRSVGARKTRVGARRRVTRARECASAGRGGLRKISDVAISDAKWKMPMHFFASTAGR